MYDFLADDVTCNLSPIFNEATTLHSLEAPSSVAVRHSDAWLFRGVINTLLGGISFHVPRVIGVCQIALRVPNSSDCIECHVLRASRSERHERSREA